MQALQLEAGVSLTGHLQQRSHGTGVVRGELGVEGIGRIEHGASAGQVGDVGVVLVREDGVVGQAFFLRAFDLGVPIGALDESAHQADAVLARQRDHVLHQFQRARLVGLQGQAEALPAGGFGGDARHQRVGHVERQLQSVHLFGVQREVQVGGCRALAQRPHAGHQLRHHAFALGVFVAWVQRAELDRQAIGQHGRVRLALGLGDVVQRTFVGLQVAQRIGFGARAFAQHVEAEAHAGVQAVHLSGLTQGLLDGLAEHELLAQQLHGAHGRGHHRFGAQPRGDAPGAQASFASVTARVMCPRQEVLGPGHRCAGESGHGRITVRAEISPAELVSGQGDGGVRVGHAQQGLGQAHQGQAFLAGNRELLEQRFERPERRWVISHCLHPWAGLPHGLVPVQCALQRLQAVPHDIGFGAARVGQAHGGLLRWRVRGLGGERWRRPWWAQRGGARISVVLPNRLSIRSTASSAVWLRTSSAGLSSTTSREPSRPVSAIISMQSWASR